MKTDKYLDKLKKIYSQTLPSSKMTAEGWEDLQSIFDPRPWSGFLTQRNFLYAFFSLLLVAGVMFGVAQASQAALPGDLLYPVKKLSEKIVTSVTGNSQKKLENRSKEIIDLQKRHDEDTVRLEQAVQEYEQTVQETKQEESEEKSDRQDDQIRKNSERKENEDGSEQIQGESDNSSQQSEDQSDDDQEDNRD